MLLIDTGTQTEVRRYFVTEAEVVSSIIFFTFDYTLA